jgi:hypothetical protein
LAPENHAVASLRWGIVPSRVASHVLLAALTLVCFATLVGPAASSNSTSSRTVATSTTAAPIPVIDPATAPRSVEVIGESLTRQVAPIEARMLRARGLVPYVEARDSESLASAYVQQRVAQAVRDDVPVVVLETAANDAFLGAGTAPPSAWAPALARFRGTLATTLAELAGRCTVLVDTRVEATADWYGLSRIGPGIDASLRAAAAADPRHVEVVPWSALSQAHGSDWFWSDGLHFGDPSHAGSGWHQVGADAYATAIADAAKNCGRA